MIYASYFLFSSFVLLGQKIQYVKLLITYFISVCNRTPAPMYYVLSCSFGNNEDIIFYCLVKKKVNSNKRVLHLLSYCRRSRTTFHERQWDFAPLNFFLLSLDMPGKPPIFTDFFLVGHYAEVLVICSNEDEEEFCFDRVGEEKEEKEKKTMKRLLRMIHWNMIRVNLVKTRLCKSNFLFLLSLPLHFLFLSLRPFIYTKNFPFCA